MKYNFQAVESKWQQVWKDTSEGKTKPTGSGKKYYCLDMFPYPSGSGLHVGHWRGYVLSDVYARIKWLQGYNILHPMGWDAFGLPAENYALQQGVHPKISTAKNIAVFKEQLQSIGALYDWSKELNTTDPQYYKWTQWIFLQMYNAGLAYEEDKEMHWCLSCKTVIANEEVINSSCERCGTVVGKKKVRQWMLKITAYADKLLAGLDKLDWPDKVKTMQRNWIGKSQGAEISFRVKNNKEIIKIYTTRHDTIYGVTFIVMAYNHDQVDTFVTQEQRDAVSAYQKECETRDIDSVGKTGVFSGSYAINPINGTEIPIYFSDYVLRDYGTGSIMAVPAHDERDYEFAQVHGLPIKYVIQNPKGRMDGPYVGDGVIINSGPFDSLKAGPPACKKIIEHLVRQGSGVAKTQYRLRDWVFSRQRYWGEPIPLVHCDACGVVPVPEDQLPVTLPDVERYEPTGTGESPLAGIDEWVNTVCPRCKGPGKRETNTMPQWAGSCWYFLRYPDPHRNDKPFDRKDLQYWLPVDLYVGGIEHAILHLLYARFYIKVLYDLGHIPFDEPFKHLFNQGMINRYSEKSGQVEKMSKSKGNVVSPDEMVSKYGSDVLRMYIMFMGPPELDCEWQDSGLEGIKRFANRFWNYITNPDSLLAESEEEELPVKKRVHSLLKDVIERINLFKPNTAIAAYMEWVNDVMAKKMKISRRSAEKVIVAFSVMAPHMASELLEKLYDKKLSDCEWPTYDTALTMQENVTFAIQVNGKLRGKITMPVNSEQSTVEERACKEIAKWLVDKEIVKTIFVPNKLVSFVIR